MLAKLNWLLKLKPFVSGIFFASVYVIVTLKP